MNNLITRDFRGDKKLKIFESFEIKEKRSLSVNENEINTRAMYIGTNSNAVSSNSLLTTPTGSFFVQSLQTEENKKNKENVIIRLFKWLKNKNKERKMMKIDVFFKSIITNAEDLKVFTERENAYKQMIKDAEDADQIALVEKLKFEQFRNTFENQLFALGMKKYITEEQLIEFSEKTEKQDNLYLTWIKNFSRILPADVLEKKKKADAMEIFDNYVVLHYDPRGTDQELTQKEIERKKDPILFGVNKCSRRLYFIADWKDEYCDLTLDQIASKLNQTLEMK